VGPEHIFLDVDPTNGTHSILKEGHIAGKRKKKRYKESNSPDQSYWPRLIYMIASNYKTINK